MRPSVRLAAAAVPAFAAPAAEAVLDRAVVIVRFRAVEALAVEDELAAAPLEAAVVLEWASCRLSGPLMRLLEQTGHLVVSADSCSSDVRS